MIKHKIILDLATTMASLGELLTDQEINLMMGEAGAVDGKVTLSSITLVTLSSITWSPCQESLGHLVKHHLVTLVTLSSITLDTLVIFSSVRKYNFTDFPQITIADFKRLMAKWTS